MSSQRDSQKIPLSTLTQPPHVLSQHVRIGLCLSHNPTAELRVISNSSSSGSRFGLVKADNSSNSRAMLPNDNEVVDLVFRGLFLSRNKSEEQDQEINNAFLYFKIKK